MNVEQLVGRCLRLQQELSNASRAQPWHSARIDRLADDLAAAEQELARLQTGREPSHGPAAMHPPSTSRLMTR